MAARQFETIEQSASSLESRMLEPEVYPLAGKALTSWEALEPHEQQLLLAEGSIDMMTPSGGVSHQRAVHHDGDGECDGGDGGDATAATAATAAGHDPLAPLTHPIAALATPFVVDTLLALPDTACNPEDPDAVVDALAASAKSALASGDPALAAAVLDTAVACLSLFVQANYTGPPPELDEAARLPMRHAHALAVTPLPKGVVVTPEIAAESETTRESDAAQAGPSDTADPDADAGADADADNGGAVPFMPTSVKRLNYPYYDDQWHRAAVHALSLDGEAAIEKAYYPWYLVVASTFLVDERVFKGLSAAMPSAYVWRARVARVHQACLLEPSATLRAVLIDEAPGLLASFASPYDLDPEVAAPGVISLGLRLCAEVAFGTMLYHRTDLAQAALQHALAVGSLKVSVQGAKGKRTKFQTFSTTHLYVSALSSVGESLMDRGADASAAPRLLPWIVPNESPVLLEELTFETDVSEAPLPLASLPLLLCYALLVRATSPSSELTDEQSRPFVRRVLDNAPKQASWATQAAALWTKSLVELRGKRTIERAFKQMQRLVELRFAQTEDPGRESNPKITQAGPPGCVRAVGVYASGLKPWWELLTDLGDIYLDKGLPRAALDCYEPLEAWESIVSCYISVRSYKRAENLVRSRLRLDPSPRLWAVLGDLLEDPKHYARAWKLSNGRFPRAQRAWGKLCFQKKDYANAIKHFELGLAINPIFPEVWFAMGMASMFAGDWDAGSRAFTRVVQLDPTHAEAWANLASVYMRSGETRKAFHAMKRALVVKREAWRMWENFLYICMSLGELDDAIMAVRATLEYNRDRQEGKVDVSVLKALVSSQKALNDKVAALDDDDNTHDATGLRNKASMRESQLSEMFSYVTSQVTTDPGVWEAYVMLLKVLDAEPLIIIETMLKRSRAAQKPGWENTADLFDVVVAASTALATELDEIESLALAKGDTRVPDALAQLRPSIILHLKGVASRSETFFDGSAARAELIRVLTDLETRTAGSSSSPAAP